MDFERLIHIREDNDLTQKDLAKILGVSHVNISNWENGKEIIPLKQLNNYANYFNVSLDYLLKLSNDKTTTNKKELDRIEIGKRIRIVREKNNLSQRALAKILNSSHSGIWSYEKGISLILTAFAYMICKNYNESMDWLCGRK